MPIANTIDQNFWPDITYLNSFKEYDILKASFVDLRTYMAVGCGQTKTQT